MDTSEAGTSDSGSDRSSRVVLVLIAFAAIGMVVVSIGLSRVVGQPEPAQHVITIPSGTAMRLNLGHDVDIIPADLDFRLRDQLIVINDDSADHQIGPFVIAAGGRLDTRFAEAATLEGFCSLHASGRVTINIGET